VRKRDVGVLVFVVSKDRLREGFVVWRIGRDGDDDNRFGTLFRVNTARANGIVCHLICRHGLEGR
jgi:hypothetical protein